MFHIPHGCNWASMDPYIGKTGHVDPNVLRCHNVCDFPTGKAFVASCRLCSHNGSAAKEFHVIELTSGET